MYCKWKVHKGSAVMSLGLIMPTFNQVTNNTEGESSSEAGYKEVKQGCIMLEFAPSNGPKKYDWSKRRAFKLGVNDIGTILAGDEFRLIHNYLIEEVPGDRSKEQTLSYSKNTQGGNSHGFLTLVHSESNTKLTVPFSPGEYAIFYTLLQRLLPTIIGFTLQEA